MHLWREIIRKKTKWPNWVRIGNIKNCEEGRSPRNKRLCMRKNKGNRGTYVRT